MVKSNGDEPSKKGGRPPHRDGPKVAYDLVDRLLVHGEPHFLDNGTETVRFPSNRELAERFGVASSVIAEYASRHQVRHRRKALQDRIENRTEEKLVELRAESAAMTRDDVIRVIESYILKFAKAIEEGRVRMDTVADLNIAIRARELLMGNAESRSEVHNFVLKLDDLQERHRAVIHCVAVTVPEESGDVQRRLPEREAEVLTADARDPQEDQHGVTQIDLHSAHDGQEGQIQVEQHDAAATQIDLPAETADQEDHRGVRSKEIRAEENCDAEDQE